MNFLINQKLFINSKWTSAKALPKTSSNGTVLVWGVNAFASLQAATDYAKSHSIDAALFIDLDKSVVYDNTDGKLTSILSQDPDIRLNQTQIETRNKATNSMTLNNSSVDDLTIGAFLNVTLNHVASDGGEIAGGDSTILHEYKKSGTTTNEKGTVNGRATGSLTLSDSKIDYAEGVYYNLPLTPPHDITYDTNILEYGWIGNPEEPRFDSDSSPILLELGGIKDVTLNNRSFLGNAVGGNLIQQNTIVTKQDCSEELCNIVKSMQTKQQAVGSLTVNGASQIGSASKYLSVNISGAGSDFDEVSGGEYVKSSKTSWQSSSGKLVQSQATSEQQKAQGSAVIRNLSEGSDDFYRDLEKYLSVQVSNSAVGNIYGGNEQYSETEKVLDSEAKTYLHNESESYSTTVTGIGAFQGDAMEGNRITGYAQVSLRNSNIRNGIFLSQGSRKREAVLSNNQFTGNQTTFSSWKEQQQGDNYISTSKDQQQGVAAGMIQLTDVTLGKSNEDVAINAATRLSGYASVNISGGAIYGNIYGGSMSSQDSSAYQYTVNAKEQASSSDLEKSVIKKNAVGTLQASGSAAKPLVIGNIAGYQKVSLTNTFVNDISATYANDDEMDLLKVQDATSRFNNGYATTFTHELRSSSVNDEASTQYSEKTTAQENASGFLSLTDSTVGNISGYLNVQCLNVAKAGTIASGKRFSVRSEKNDSTYDAKTEKTTQSSSESNAYKISAAGTFEASATTTTGTIEAIHGFKTIQLSGDIHAEIIDSAERESLESSSSELDKKRQLQKTTEIDNLSHKSSASVSIQQANVETIHGASKVEITQSTGGDLNLRAENGFENIENNRWSNSADTLQAIQNIVEGKNSSVATLTMTNSVRDGAISIRDYKSVTLQNVSASSISFDSFNESFSNIQQIARVRENAEQADYDRKYAKNRQAAGTLNFAQTTCSPNSLFTGVLKLTAEASSLGHIYGYSTQTTFEETSSGAFNSDGAYLDYDSVSDVERDYTLIQQATGVVTLKGSSAGDIVGAQSVSLSLNQRTACQIGNAKGGNITTNIKEHYDYGVQSVAKQEIYLSAGSFTQESGSTKQISGFLNVSLSGVHLNGASGGIITTIGTLHLEGKYENHDVGGLSPYYEWNWDEFDQVESTTSNAGSFNAEDTRVSGDILNFSKVALDESTVLGTIEAQTTSQAFLGLEDENQLLGMVSGFSQVVTSGVLNHFSGGFSGTESCDVFKIQKDSSVLFSSDGEDSIWDFGDGNDTMVIDGVWKSNVMVDNLENIAGSGTLLLTSQAYSDLQEAIQSQTISVSSKINIFDIGEGICPWRNFTTSKQEHADDTAAKAESLDGWVDEQGWLNADTTQPFTDLVDWYQFKTTELNDSLLFIDQDEKATGNLELHLFDSKLKTDFTDLAVSLTEYGYKIDTSKLAAGSYKFELLAKDDSQPINYVITNGIA